MKSSFNRPSNSTPRPCFGLSPVAFAGFVLIYRPSIRYILLWEMRFLYYIIPSLHPALSGKYGIKLRCDKFAAQLVRERVWHASQEILELTGGGIEFRVTLSSLNEIEPWILSWGRHVWVLSPDSLRTRLA
jgi:hypothetical protein